MLPAGALVIPSVILAESEGRPHTVLYFGSHKATNQRSIVVILVVNFDI